MLVLIYSSYIILASPRVCYFLFCKTMDSDAYIPVFYSFVTELPKQWLLKQ